MKLFTQNGWCWFAIGVATALQMFLTYTPVVNSVFYNAPIDGMAWVRIIGFSIAIFLIIEMEKAIGPKYLMPMIRWDTMQILWEPASVEFSARIRIV